MGATLNHQPQIDKDWHGDEDGVRPAWQIRQWAMERAAEKALTGGYTPKQHPVCPDCGLQKSRTGTCFC